MELFEQAASLWQTVNVGDQPTDPRFSSFSIPDGLLDQLEGFVFLNIRPSIIDDIHISAREMIMDGNFGILGRAGPALTSGGIPVAGFMEFDQDDVSRLKSSDRNLILNTITHEMGHVQGIGTVVSSNYVGNTSKHQKIFSANNSVS